MKMMMTLMALLLVMVMGSVFGVIYSKHQSRKLFVEIQQINKQIDELNVDWGRL